MPTKAVPAEERITGNKAQMFPFRKKPPRMRKLILFLPLLLIMVFSHDASAQKRSKGFDYAGHHRMNMKAKRWGKHRLKAANHDQTNLRCSVRTSRRAARRSRAAG